MTEEIAEKQYAFPSTFKSLAGSEQTHVFGMQLRDYFAAKAMQGVISTLNKGDEHQLPLAPILAYQIADLMMKEREKKND